MNVKHVFLFYSLGNYLKIVFILSKGTDTVYWTIQHNNNMKTVIHKKKVCSVSQAK